MQTSRVDMPIDAASPIFSPQLKAGEFANELESLASAFHLIERVDIDRIDVDNFAMVLVQIMKRRKRLNALPPLARAWLKFRAALFMSGSTSSLRASEQLHVVLVGRRFSSRLSPMVYNSDKNCFELETWDQRKEEAEKEVKISNVSPGEGNRSCEKPRIVEVLPHELSAHIKQAPWEQQWWNEEEENKLLGLHAAHLRAFLTASGVESWEYACYHGGIATLAGLSCHVHVCEFEFLRDPTCASFELTPGEDLLTEWPKQWRAMTVAERKAHFDQRAEAPPPHMSALLPLSAFTARCSEAVTPLSVDLTTMATPATQNDSDSVDSGKAHSMSTRLFPPLALYIGSPITAIHATFSHDSALRDRVAYCCAMSGAWEGSENLLGCCFNNAVDYAASREVCQSNYFSNGRLLLVPTETCKMGPFVLTAERLKAMAAGSSTFSQVASAPLINKVTNLKANLVANVQQWTDLKRGVAQPLFDVLTIWELSKLLEHTAIVPTEVQFGRNVYAPGTLYENLGVTLCNTNLTLQSFSHENVTSSLPLPNPLTNIDALNQAQESENNDIPATLEKSQQPLKTSPAPASLSEVPGRIGSTSVFAPGCIYATERVFSSGCAAAFAQIFEEMLVDSS